MNKYYEIFMVFVCFHFHSSDSLYPDGSKTLRLFVVVVTFCVYVYIYTRKPKQMLIFFYFLTWLDSPFHLTSCAPLNFLTSCCLPRLPTFLMLFIHFIPHFLQKTKTKTNLRQRYCFNNFLIYFSFFQRH